MAGKKAKETKTLEESLVGAVIEAAEEIPGKNVVVDNPAATTKDLSRFSAEVFMVIKNELAKQVGGNISLGVKLAAEYFTLKAPAEVKAGELMSVIPAIVMKFRTEQGILSFDEEAAKNWAEGRWTDKVSIKGLLRRYPGTILTTAMIDTYAAELEEWTKKHEALLGETQDPDIGPMPCGFPTHPTRNNPSIQSLVRYIVVTNKETGELSRLSHENSEEPILIGDFIVPEKDVPELGLQRGSVVFCCPRCADRAREIARSAYAKLPFYTYEKAQRKSEGIKRSDEKQRERVDQASALVGASSRNPRDQGDGFYRGKKMTGTRGGEHRVTGKSHR